MAKIPVGLDVGSSSCHLVALDQEGRMLRNLKFTTSEEKGIVNLLRSLKSIRLV